MPVPPSTRPVQRRSARLLVFDQLRGWIEDGTLAPGEVVRDAEIARTLGVSRTPVREGLQMLEQLGWVVTEPGRRTRVASAEPNHATLVYPPLAALQALAAEQATPDATSEDLLQMNEANERLLAAARAGDPNAARAADHDFHAVLIARAENSYLSHAVEFLELHIRRLETLYFSHLGPSAESYEEHCALIDAVAKRNGTQAAAITRKNFLRGTNAAAPQQRPAARAEDEPHDLGA